MAWTNARASSWSSCPVFPRKDVVDVSGRGVGMDVVRTNIQKLNGNIDIKSTPGKGSPLSSSPCR
jgi:K+-sensing histidine kinase KdpD